MLDFDVNPQVAFIENSLITFCISSLLSFLLYFCECIFIKILYDININTSLKEKLDEILFSDLEVRKKRIALRKLKRKGLDNKYIKIFNDYKAKVKHMIEVEGMSGDEVEEVLNKC